MRILFQNNALRLIAFCFCSVFLLQIAADTVFKLSDWNKKQSSLQEKNQDDDSSKDDQEKEKESEKDYEEDDCKELHPLLFLSGIAETKLSTLQKHLKHHCLPAGFFKTFNPPPEV
ncbi:MAG: hypothetical protein NT150_07675 [Bacteroidetes bacterium]|nr:hypothetical protein [Bacteroidota bacterium]